MFQSFDNVMAIRQSEVRDILSQFTDLSDSALDGASRDVATVYGRAESEGKREASTRQLSGTVKNGVGIIRDPRGIMVPATPSVRLFLACCQLRDTLAKLASPKGAYGFASAGPCRLTCPGLDKAFSKPTVAESVENPVPA